MMSHAPSATVNRASFDVQGIRAQFPALHQQVHGKPLVYLDNAATTQKPQAVIDALRYYYERDNSNVHRGVHTLSERATAAFEGARKAVQQFVHARSEREIIFTRNATESINLVARAWGDWTLTAGDEVLITAIEHHSNIVPWQMACARTGAVLKVAPIDDNGDVLMDEFEALVSERTKMVAVTHLSNALGTINPVEQMVALARRVGATVLIDGSQAVYHMAVDVQALDADFYVFTGHKVYGPTGIGVLYGRESILQAMPPFLGGGDMISSVTFEKSEWNELPYKFEAGTPNIADAVGLGASLDYVTRLGLPNIAEYEHELLEYGTERLAGIDGLRLVGTAREKVGVLSFVLPGKQTEEVGKLLDLEGIAVRAGHHCSHPSLRRFGLESTVRPSLAFYNTKEEIDRLVDAVRRIQQR